MRRHITSTAILIAVTAVLAGCVPGLAADPRFATNRGARPQGQVINKPPPVGPPPIAAPKNDLAWHDCTPRLFADAGVPAAPGRVSGPQTSDLTPAIPSRGIWRFRAIIGASATPVSGNCGRYRPSMKPR